MSNNFKPGDHVATVFNKSLLGKVVGVGAVGPILVDFGELGELLVLRDTLIPASESGCAVFFSVGVWCSESDTRYQVTLNTFREYIEAFRHPKVNHIEADGEILNVVKLGE